MSAIGYFVLTYFKDTHGFCIVSNVQSRLMRWVRDTCLSAGLLSFNTFCIAASLSSQTINLSCFDVVPLATFVEDEVESPQGSMVREQRHNVVPEAQSGEALDPNSVVKSDNFCFCG